MSAYNDIETKIAGQKQSTDSGQVFSKRSAQITGIPYGMPVWGYAGNADDVYLYRDNISTMTFDGDFSAGDVISITVDGTAVTPITFAGDHDTTMAALVAQIEADITGANATGVARVLTIEIEDGINRVVTETVIGGGEATGTETVSSGMIFKGISLFTQKENAVRTDLDGNVIDAADALYELKDTANIIQEGLVTVVTGASVISGMQAYTVKTGALQGTVTTTVGSNIIMPGCTVEDDVTGAGLANVRILK